MARLLLMFSGVVTGVVVARAYGTQGRGEIALVTAIYGNLGTLFTLGIEVAAVHLVGRRSDLSASVAATVRTTAIVLGILAGISSVALTLALSHQFDSGSHIIILASATAAAPLVASVLIQGHLLGIGRLLEVAWLTALRGLLILLAVMIVTSAGMGASVALAAYALTEYAILVATLVLSRTAAPGAGMRAPRRTMRQLIRYGLAGHVGTVLQSANYRFDILLLGAMVSLAEVGRYSVAVAVVELLWVLPLVLKNYVIQRVASSTTAGGNTVAISAFRLSIAGTVPGGAAVALAAPLLVPWVFGRDFDVAVPLIFVLIPGVCAMALYQTMMNDLLGRGHPKVKSVTALAGCIVTLILDLILIPQYGALGAAIGSSVAYCATFAAAAPLYRRITGTRYRDWLPTLADANRALKAVPLRRRPTRAT